MTYAVDFDGTLCEDAWPGIGSPRHETIGLVKGLLRGGHKVILWTCRSGADLMEACEWCAGHGLRFHAINANLPENIERHGGDTRKVYADFYIDDKAVPPWMWRLIRR